jgi:hypothetical protein
MAAARLWSDSTVLNQALAFSFLFERGLFRKPVPSFRDHALCRLILQHTVDELPAFLQFVQRALQPPHALKRKARLERGRRRSTFCGPGFLRLVSGRLGSRCLEQAEQRPGSGIRRQALGIACRSFI